eukprot:1940336-Pleurochrysis_carterae.AAC.1
MLARPEPEGAEWSHRSIERALVVKVVAVSQRAAGMRRGRIVAASIVAASSDRSEAAERR